ncbi:root phototropism protein 3-like [Bidens hawaiensis]|uniref:root phototropism protein 3-like n=1 Tax=Bidens hawaiensis TaxID=980011 RepID=UPI00404AF91F
MVHELLNGYVLTDIPSDLMVQVGEFSFHLHKFPLLSKSGKINRMMYESRETELRKVSLNELPVGPEAFELAAKFCYGVAIDLTARSIAALRCAAEHLEMTEDLEEGNLFVKTEAFINYVVLSSWEDSISVLRSCEELSTWAENLQIVRRCSESIAWKACVDSTGNPKGSAPNTSPDRWCEDVLVLRIDHFVRVITAVKVKGMKHELVGAGIMHYAMKSLPGMMKDGSPGPGEDGGASKWNCGPRAITAAKRDDPYSSLERKDQGTIVKSLISIIPPQNDSVTCSFLLRLLKVANMVNVSPALVIELEKRAGMQLEKANEETLTTLSDLLIPCFNKNGTTYDVDLCQRLLEHFLIQGPIDVSGPLTNPVVNAKPIVARLVDSYLAEVSRNENLSLTKFQALAQALPGSARSCDDGLYCAIDSYLKAHPMLSEHERTRLCRLMDCQKLSMEACAHAAQNERLPVRIVIQVILSEQIKLNNALANASSRDHHYQPVIPNTKTLLEETPQSFQDGWENAKKDISALKFDLESVKTKYLELQHDMEGLQQQFDKVTDFKHKSAWSSSWKKLIKMTKITTIEKAGSGSPAIKTPKR